MVGLDIIMRVYGPVYDGIHKYKCTEAQVA